MCGIYFASPIAENLCIEKLTNALSMLSRRGPNSSGYKVFKETIFMGSTRLNVVTNSEEDNMPFFSRDKRICIIFNGFIQNYKSLRSRLESVGYRFRGESDTEVIVALYQVYGVKGFHQLDGMWAFILYDLENNNIYVSRDRFGIKPLFVTTTENKSILISSEINAFSPLVQLKVNWNVSCLYLVAAITDSTCSTFFEGIYSIPAGKVGLVIDNEIKYVEDLNVNLFSSPESSVVCSLLQTVNESIDNNHAALPLSSGLDSSAIAIAAYHLGKNKSIDAFTLVTPFSDESKDAARLAKSLGINHEIVSISSEEYLTHLRATVKAQNQPFTRTNIISQFILCKYLSSSGYQNVLSGCGGDEIMAGYQSMRNEWLASLSLTTHDSLGSLKEILARENIAFHQYKKSLISELKRDQITMWPFLESQDKSFTKDCLSRYNEMPVEVSGFDYLMDKIHRRVWGAFLPSMLRFEDLNSSNFGMETRLPFLSTSFVSNYWSQPKEFYWNKGYNKYNFRNAISSLGDYSFITENIQKKGLPGNDDRFLKNFGPSIINGLELLRALFGQDLGLTEEDYYSADKIEPHKRQALFRVGIFYEWINQFSVIA